MINHYVSCRLVDYLEYKHREIVLLQFAFLDKSFVDGMLQHMQHSEGRGIGNQWDSEQAGRRK